MLQPEMRPLLSGLLERFCAAEDPSPREVRCPAWRALQGRTSRHPNPLSPLAASQVRVPPAGRDMARRHPGTPTVPRTPNPVPCSPYPPPPSQVTTTLVGLSQLRFKWGLLPAPTRAALVAAVDGAAPALNDREVRPI